MMANLRTLFFFTSLFISAIESSCPNNTVPWSNGNCKSISDAVKEATQFLQDEMPDFDKPNNATLFDGGIVEPTVNISLMARQKYAWAASVPLDIYFDYVLPYATVNEARTNWRQILWDKLTPMVDRFVKARKHFNVRGGFTTYETIALYVNAHIWKVLAPKGTDSIVFKSSQTPLIYDPMSTMLFGFASCTGISILYIDSLRTLGVPARLVGTPAWNGQIENGNHNWVEVWLGEDIGWKFIEGQPTGVTETFENPCDKWFCTKSRFGAPGQTKVFASRFSKSDVSYQMSWDLKNQDIPGVDRIEFYYENCKSCGSSQIPLVNFV